MAGGIGPTPPTSARTFDSGRTQTVTSQRDPIYSDFSLPELPYLRGPQLQAQILSRPGPPLAGVNAEDERMKQMRNRDELLQMQARQRPAPKRLVTGAQIIPGEVMDDMAMNAYTRAAYLPQNTQMQGRMSDSALQSGGPLDVTNGPTNRGGAY